jgi:photosystem II stability/assembly factor-like uncharacterized protein
MSSGKTAGIFSVTFWNAKQGVAVGGDYTKEKEAKDNVATTKDGGRTWTLIKGRSPGGYRSCVVFIPGTVSPVLIAIGPSGSDFSVDKGKSWAKINSDGYHSVSFADSSNGWAVGERGRIGKYLMRLLFHKVDKARMLRSGRTYSLLKLRLNNRSDIL